jgi:hypothetical protein
MFASGGLWRLGIKEAGRKLARAVGSDDEQVSTLAGMFLVRAGSRSVPVVIEALGRESAPPVLASILGDLGGPQAEAELRRLAEGEGELARVARRALYDLEQIKQTPD